MLVSKELTSLQGVMKPGAGYFGTVHARISLSQENPSLWLSRHGHVCKCPAQLCRAKESRWDSAKTESHHQGFKETLSAGHRQKRFSVSQVSYSGLCCCFFRIVGGWVWSRFFALIPQNNQAQVAGKAAQSQMQQPGSRNISEVGQRKTPTQEEGGSCILVRTLQHKARSSKCSCWQKRLDDLPCLAFADPNYHSNLWVRKSR